MINAHDLKIIKQVERRINSESTDKAKNLYLHLFKKKVYNPKWFSNRTTNFFLNVFKVFVNCHKNSLNNKLIKHFR